MPKKITASERGDNKKAYTDRVRIIERKATMLSLKVKPNVTEFMSHFKRGRRFVYSVWNKTVDEIPVPQKRGNYLIFLCVVLRLSFF